MLQYLINVSIVWLGALSVFELLLRKQHTHQHNRIYLMASLCLGLLLPLIHTDRFAPSGNGNILLQPTVQVYKIKQALQAVPTLTSSPQITSGENNIVFILWAIYLVGLLTTFAFIVREAVLLGRLYKGGQKTQSDGYTIVETGKDHGPCSFFKIIFVSRREDYTADQWNLLLAHEKEHGRRGHSLDHILVLLLRTLFWFHPLAYIYYNRLRLVHEYQADDAAAINIAAYSSFLLEQSMMQGGPALTLSLNYSPLKKRIDMLNITKKSGTGRRYLVVFPLLFVLLLFCTQTSLTRGKDIKASNDNKINFRGKEVKFDRMKVIPYSYQQDMERQKALFGYMSLPDSVPVKNPLTGIAKMQAVEYDTMPVAVDGRPVYGKESQYMFPDEDTTFTDPVFSGAGNDFYKYIFSNTKSLLDQLEDGEYIFMTDRIVIDDRGDIVYYEYRGLNVFMSEQERHPVIKDDLRQAINKQVVEVFNNPVKFKPAIKDGIPVNARLSRNNYEIVVKGHKARLAERAGC